MRHFPSTQFGSPTNAEASAQERSVGAPRDDDRAIPRRAARPRAMKLLIASGVTLIVATILTTAALVLNFRDRALSDAERELANTALILAEQSDRAFQSLELVQVSLIERMKALGINSHEDYRRLMSSHDVHLMLRDKISGLPHVDALALADADGNLVNFSRFWPIPEINGADREYFKSLKANTDLVSVVSEPLKNRSTGTWTIFLARKFTAADGAFLGAVLGVMELQYFETFFGAIALGPHSSVALSRDDGMLLVRHPRVEASIGKHYRGGLEALAGHKSKVSRIVSRIDEKERLIALHHLSSYPLVAGVTNEVSAILGPWQREVGYLLGAGGLITLVICLTVGLVARELRRGMWEAQRRLEGEKRKLDAALNHMTQGLCMFDAAARLVLCNQRYLSMYGLASDVAKPGVTLRELVGHRKAAGSFLGDPETHCDDVMAAIARGSVARHLADASNGRVIEVVNQPMTGGGWIATHNDVTLQQRAEADIKAARAKAECAEREA